MSNKKKSDKTNELKTEWTGPVVCVTKCFAGRIWPVGKKTTVEAVKRASGGSFPQKHFARRGSEEAKNVSAEAKKEASSLRNFLISKKVIPPADASLDTLRKLAEKHENMTPGAESRLDDGQGGVKTAEQIQDEIDNADLETADPLDA